MHLREVGTVGGQRSGSLTRGSPRSTGRPTGTERGSQVQPKREGPSGLCCGEGLRDKGGSKLGWAPSRSPGPGLLGGPEQDACPLWARPLPWCSPGHGPQSAPVSFPPPCSHFTPAEATRGKSRGEQRPRAQSTARRWGQPRTQGRGGDSDPLRAQRSPHTHRQTHSHIYRDTHTLTYTQTHAQNTTHTLTYTDTHRDRHRLTVTYTDTHTHSHIHRHMHRIPHTLMYIDTHRDRHRHTVMYTHTHNTTTHIRTHTYTQYHTHTTHIHKYTHNTTHT